MQSRSRYSNENSKKFERAQGAVLAKTLKQRATEMRQKVQAGRATKSYAEIPTARTLVNEDTATQKINPKPRGYEFNSSAKKEYEVSSMGATRSTHRTLAYTETRAPPTAIITKRFVEPNRGNRTVIRREKYAAEGTGALDVMYANLTEITKQIPGMHQPTRGVSKFLGHARGANSIISNQKTTVLPQQPNFVTRNGFKTTKRDGALLTNVPFLNKDQFYKDSLATTNRFQNIAGEQRSMLTLKNPNSFRLRPPLPRMVDNVERF